MKKGSEVDSRRGDNTKEDNDGGMQLKKFFHYSIRVQFFRSYNIILKLILKNPNIKGREKERESFFRRPSVGMGGAYLVWGQHHNSKVM